MFKKFLLAVLLVVGSFVTHTAMAGECQQYELAHPNFPLNGSHLQAGKCTLCSSCHVKGVFVGTPKQCLVCHAANNISGATPLPSSHFPTGTADCGTCHNTTSFSTTWNMDHSVVSSLTCTICHNGNYLGYNALSQSSCCTPAALGVASGTAFQHPVTSGQDCAASGCHVSPNPGMSLPENLWQLSLVQIHANIGTTACSTCHDGVHATGKNNVPTSTSLPNGHPVVTQDCGTCHSTTALFRCAQAWDRFLAGLSWMWRDLFEPVAVSG